MQRLLIGYGNPLRCDDGVGWFLASQLMSFVESESVQIIAAHQISPEMSEVVSRAKEVLFVDAAVGDAPGTWTVHSVQLNRQETFSSLGHHLTPAMLLMLSHMLYNAAPIGQIITVVGADFGYGETFSKAVETALPHVQDYIVDFLRGS